MITLQIELPEQHAAALKAHAQSLGLTVDQWLLQLANDLELFNSAPLHERENLRPLAELFADTMKDIPEEELSALPKDGSSQIDHYLYGHPKS